MNKILFPKITLWLLLLVPFTIWGFFPSYFGKLFAKQPSIFHIHAFFMILWIGLAIIQPILIKQKKTKLHRLIGKVSYFIMPLVFISTYFMIRHIYYKQIERLTIVSKEKATVTAAEAQANAGVVVTIGLMYLFLLISFYSLAIINRKKILPHATFMFAAILTLLGPTVDRILFQVYDYYSIEFNLFAELFVFVMIDLLLISLAVYQHRKSLSIKPVLTALTVYIIGQVAYFLLPKLKAWPAFVDIIM